MLRHSVLAGRKSAKNIVSALAMAVALTGAGLAASAVGSTPAAAQEYSRAFIDIYTPAADVVNAEGGDVASVAGQFPAIVAAAQTADEKFAAGNLILIAGNKASNATWQRQGLELQLASGKVAPEQIGLFNWFVGSLAFSAQDYAAARAALQIAQQNNYADGDVHGLIAETYYQQGNAAGGLAYIRRAIETTTAAGGAVPQQWVLRSLQAAYNSNMTAEAIDASIMLVTYHANQENWLRALQVANSLGDFDPQARLDLMRLMRLTNTLTDRSEYIRYIEDADPRIMSNEVAVVLGEAVAAGHLAEGDTYTTEVRAIVTDRMGDDRAEAPSLVAEARSSANGRDALVAGDVLYSLNDFAGAEEMYALALEKGGVDTATAQTRLGIAQVRQGKNAAGAATLSQVTGPRATVAKLWATYAANQG
jgi:tetratricopeptide (TPR) repeat protein